MKHEPVMGGGMKIVQLIVNRSAGRHDRRTVSALAKAFDQAGARAIRTECGPSRDIEIDPRAQLVCVIGGDGTLRHAALAIARSERSVGLSIYPAGTVNLLHHEVPCDLDPDIFAARALRNISPRKQYAASLDDGLFLACASVGPDSAAVAMLSRGLKRWIGRVAYAVAFAGIMAKWRRPEIILCHDGRALRCEAFYVAKGRFFAGPWSFAPEARGSDPLLHVVALKRATRSIFARFVWAMLRGHPIEEVPGAICFTCTKLSADCAAPLPVQADGDIVAALPVEMGVRPEALTFY